MLLIRAIRITAFRNHTSMTTPTENAYRIALTRIDLIGDVLAKRLIGFFGSAENIFREKPAHLKKIVRIGESVAANIQAQQSDALAFAEQELQFIEKNNIEVIPFEAEHYPTRLKQCEDAPLLLYHKGNTPFNAKHALAVVGTRRITAKGKELTEEMIDGLKNFGQDMLIVSGLAHGVDIAAHRQAIKSKLPTVGVLGHGLDRIYPHEHRQYAIQMLENGGLLTDFPSRTNPDKENFPQRNRIIAGMCDALVVVESRRQGGSMITANLAFGYQREVFAFPGRPGELNTEGCNLLIKSLKASLIEHAPDLCRAMNWAVNARQKAKSVQPKLFVELNPQETKIAAILEKGKKPFDEICFELKQNPGIVSFALLNLEMNGILRALPGKQYELLR